MTDLDFTGTDFSAYTVGELFALLRNPDFREGVYVTDGTNEVYRRNIPTADLMKLAEVGKSLFKEAVAVADDQDNAEFFTEAFSLYGPLVTAALEEMNLPYRSTHDGTAIVEAS